jgi:hypothetical protein
LDHKPLRCNNRNPLLSGLVACAPGLQSELVALVSDNLPAISEKR